MHGRYNEQMLRLPRLASALSLLLCLATVVLWVRSYYRVECVVLNDRNDLRTMPFGGWFDRGAFIIIQSRPHGGFIEHLGWGSYSGANADDARGFLHGILYYAHARGDFGFMWGSYVNNHGGGYSVVALPLWMLVCLFGIIPAIAIVRQCRKRPPIVGMCPHCGYDVRATPNRCPECGALPTHTPA
jgi:hypothetical protein